MIHASDCAIYNAPAYPPGECDCHRTPAPIVCLPLMRIPATPEKPTKYLPEVWKPNGQN